MYDLAWVPMQYAFLEASAGSDSTVINGTSCTVVLTGITGVVYGAPTDTATIQVDGGDLFQIEVFASGSGTFEAFTETCFIVLNPDDTLTLKTTSTQHASVMFSGYIVNTNS